MPVMTDETKMILKKLEEMSHEIGEVKEAVAEVRDIAIEARDMAGKAYDMAIEARDTAIEARDMAIEARDIALKAEKAALKTQMTLEVEISTKIDIIGEGHDFLKNKLDEALLMEKKREAMELELISHRMDIKRMKEYLDIA